MKTIQESERSKTNNTNSSSENSAINGNDTSIKDQCNTCDQDTHRRSLLIEGSDSVHACSDVSNDSGIYSTTSSIEVEHSPVHSKSKELSPCESEKKIFGNNDNNNVSATVFHKDVAQQKSNTNKTSMYFVFHSNINKDNIA